VELTSTSSREGEDEEEEGSEINVDYNPSISTVRVSWEQLYKEDVELTDVVSVVVS